MALMSGTEAACIAFVVLLLGLLVWATAHFGQGYRDEELQFDPNSPIPASEEERAKRVAAIVAGAVVVVYGLVVIAAIAMRG